MKKSKFTLQIEKYLTSQAPQKIKSQFKPEDYISGKVNEKSQLSFLNMSMPQLQLSLKKFKPNPAESYSEDLFKDMQALWIESNIWEAKMFSLYWLIKQKDEFLIKNAKAVLKWVNIVDNWAHSDAYCSVIARMHDVAPTTLQPTMLNWNKSKNPWLRRCSMVSLYYYSRQRTNPASFNLAAQFVNPHFEAPEYYVQKAVGWTIREMYNVYPKETVRFIQKNNPQLSSVAWVAATEKLEPHVKNPLLIARKAHRQGKPRP
jgi:3-methyladenine DNA glycosylase AlkD